MPLRCPRGEMQGDSSVGSASRRPRPGALREEPTPAGGVDTYHQVALVVVNLPRLGPRREPADHVPIRVVGSHHGDRAVGECVRRHP